jgi:hypothetical protein
MTHLFKEAFIMHEHVKIPLDLLDKAIYVLEHIYIEPYDAAFQDECGSALLALRGKKQSLRLRDAYARIVCAKDGDARHSARMEYLRLKREAGGGA